MEKGDQAERLGNDKKGAPLAHLVNTADAVKPVGETLRTGEKNPAPNGRGAGCEWLSGTLRLTLRGFFKQPVDKVVAKIRKGLVYIDKDIDWCMSTRTSIGVCRQGHRLVYVDKDIDWCMSTRTSIVLSEKSSSGRMGRAVGYWLMLRCSFALITSMFK